MRGLTAAERLELSDWTPGGLAFSEEAIASLVATGRAVWVSKRDVRRTDMAYLALRVCPVGEP